MAGLLLPQGGQAAVGILTRLSVLLLAHGGPGTTTCSPMMIPSSRSRLRASPRWPRDREALSQHPGVSAASAAQNAPSARSAQQAEAQQEPRRTADIACRDDRGAVTVGTEAPVWQGR